MPRLITFSSGNSIGIVYDASGNKLRKIVKQGGTVQYEQDYAGGVEYRKTPASGTFRIEAIYHEEGRYFNLNVETSNTVSWRKKYALRDHLGNTRIMFADKNANGIVEITGNASTNEILQENHYYPFGLSYEGPAWMNDATRDNKYQYNGKEWNDDFGLNWNDYGARWYDAAVGRFHTIDNSSENYYSFTPYNYVGNNPIKRVDPDGNDWWDAVVGTAIGVVTNVVPGSTNLRNAYTPTDAADYNNALRSTDAAAMAIGEGMVKGGAGAVATGGAVALAGGTVSLSGVGATVGAPTAAVGSAVAGAGAATAAGGAVLMVNGANNASAGYNYGDLKEPRNVGDGKSTTPSQRQRILDENKKQNNGTLKSDGDGRVLDKPSKNVKGEKANMNQAEVDHIKPKSKGGSNSNSNLRVISKEENLKKSNRENRQY